MRTSKTFSISRDMGSGCICVPLVWIWWASQSSSRRHTNPLDSGVTDVSGAIVPAVEVFNAVRGGGDKKEDEEKDSGLDVGNVLQKVTGGNDDKGGEWVLTTVWRTTRGQSQAFTFNFVCLACIFYHFTMIKFGVINMMNMWRERKQKARMRVKSEKDEIYVQINVVGTLAH